MPAGQGKEAIQEARILADEEAGMGPAAVSTADRPGEVGVNKCGVAAVWPSLPFAWLLGAASKGLIPSMSCDCAVCRWCGHSVCVPHLALCCLRYMLTITMNVTVNLPHHIYCTHHAAGPYSRQSMSADAADAWCRAHWCRAAGSRTEGVGLHAQGPGPEKVY